VQAVLCWAALGSPLAGQALTGTELGVGAITTWARRDFYGSGLEVGFRPGGEGRVTFSGAGGTVDGHPGIRLETTAQFLVAPGARAGISPYGGVGVAYVGSRFYHGAGALVLLVGAESAAGRRRGWFGELGLGNGVRARVGYRWRWLPVWWP
jgi:hypothetical protein